MAVNKIIDVSAYNGKVNWREAKRQGVQGAIIKIINKKLDIDNQFTNNIVGCEDFEIPWGVYNYSYATTKEKAKSDMRVVCDILDSLSMKDCCELGVWFDIEDKVQAALSKERIAQILNTAKKVVEKRGYKFGIYTGLSFYKEHIDKNLVKCNRWWIARYYKGYKGMLFKEIPDEAYKPMSNIFAWQYTSVGKFVPQICPGNDGCVDLNVMYESLEGSGKKEDVKEVSVKIGSARINEKGTVTGGKAGDQTGGEVSTQNWYLHSKGWFVIRPKDKAAAEKIAKCMEMACANNNIGYCQTHRNDLLKASKKYGYSVDKVKDKVEVDCSALVRVCCLYAGISVSDFNTTSQKQVLRNTGKFDILTDKEICGSSDKLKRGDILVTKTKGHTVVVLSDGKDAGKGGYAYMFEVEQIKKKSKGKYVKLAQKILKGMGYYDGKIDGDFGSVMENAVRGYQKAYNMTVDGIIGKNMWKSLIGV